MLRDDLIAFLDDLEKGANHKYIRRIPTGKPKPRYRYIYDARKAVDTKARPQVGEKIKIEHNGQAGHYEVKRAMRDGRCVVQHDETGHRMVIRNAKLHDLVRDTHAPADPKLENERLDEKHRKVDLLPRSRQSVLEAIKRASGIEDHDLAQADAAYAAWKGRGRKGPKPPPPKGKGGELDAFSADLKRGQKFSSLLEAFEHATKGAKTWRDIAPIVSQLREVPGFENAHLPEDALLRHVMQDEERRNAHDTKRPNPEDYGTAVPESVDEGGFDWNTGEQHPAMATPAEAKAAKKRARATKQAPATSPLVVAPPAYTPTDPDAPDAERPVEDTGGEASFDFGANAPSDEDDDIMWRSQRNLVIDLAKAFDGAPAATQVSRQRPGSGRTGEGSRGGHIVGHTPTGDPIYAKAGGAAPGAAPAPAGGDDPHAAFQKLQAAHAAAMAQMQQAHAAMMAHAQKHGIAMPGGTQTDATDPTRVSRKPGEATKTGPSDPTRIQHSVARGPSAADPESTGVVAPQKPAEKTATKKGPTDHLTGPASGESPEESVPKANGILEHGIVGHTSSGKQIKLGMNHETLSPREAHEASLLHREAQEHLLNAGRHSPNPAYKKAARAHLDEEFALASKAVTGQTEAAHYVDPDEEQIGSVFSSAKKSLAGWEAFSSWSPSAMWAGEDIGITFGARLEKALGGERAGHKYIKRTPRAGGGYDYEYADTPHSKETLKGAPLGSQLEVEHNGETATYTKVGRDDWKGAVGGVIASGWFVGKPGTFTHGAPHPEPGASAAPAVDPGMWRHQPKFGAAGGPLEHVLTPEGAARAFQIGAQLNAPASAALADLDGGARAIESRTGSKMDLTDFGRKHGTALSDLTSRGLAELRTSTDGRSYSLTAAGRAAVARGREEQGRLLDRVRRAHPLPETKPAPKFELTAAPVQQGLFAASSLEKKPEPKKPDLSQDPRQQGMFAAPSPMAQATAEAEKQPATGKYGPPPKSTGLTEADREMIARTTTKPESVLKTPNIPRKVAHQLGREAALAGLGPQPPAHEPMRKLMEGGAVGQHIDAMKAWHAGWMEANLEKPVEEEPKPSPMAEATKEAEKQPAPSGSGWEGSKRPTLAELAALPVGSVLRRDGEPDATKMGSGQWSWSGHTITDRDLLDTEEGGGSYTATVPKPALTDAQKDARERLDAARERHKARKEAAAKDPAPTPVPPATAAKEQQAVKEATQTIADDPVLTEGQQLLSPKTSATLGADKALAQKLLDTTSKQREWAVGRHIWGSAKDKRDAMALIAEGRIGDLSHEAAATLINRTSLMPAFDSDDARTRGVSPGAAHMIQTMTALVAPKPADSKPETIDAYARGIRLVAASLQNAKTRKDVEEVIIDLRRMVSTGREISQHDTRAAAQAAAVNAGPHASVSSEYVNGKTTYTVMDQNPATKEAILALGQRFAVQTGLGTYRREHFYATGPYGTAWGGMGYGKVFNDAARLAREADAKGEDGWAHVGAKKAAESAARAGKTKETRIPPWRRTVPEKPEFGATTKAVAHGDKDRFGKTFGIAVQRGEAISDKDLDHHLRHAEMALSDMARVLAIDPKLVSFNGRLGIAFGARGHGGAVAHYEPVTKAINLTRNAGAGSLAHEWGHFMDNVLHETQTGKKGSATPYVSEATQGLPADLAAAVSGVYDAIHKHPDQAAARAAWKKRKDELRTQVDAAKAAYTGTTGEARSRAIDEYNALVTEHNTHVRSDWDASGFKRDALERDAGKSKKYWSSGREMWARAFESYVQDKLAAEGGNNSYLVSGTKGGPGQPYPEGDERKRINAAFDKFFAVVRSGRHLEKALKALSSTRLTARNAGPNLVIA